MLLGPCMAPMARWLVCPSCQHWGSWWRVLLMSADQAIGSFSASLVVGHVIKRASPLVSTPIYSPTCFFRRLPCPRSSNLPLYKSLNSLPRSCLWPETIYPNFRSQKWMTRGTTRVLPVGRVFPHHWYLRPPLSGAVMTTHPFQLAPQPLLSPLAATPTLLFITAASPWLLMARVAIASRETSAVNASSSISPGLQGWGMPKELHNDAGAPLTSPWPWKMTYLPGLPM